jgi:hypothetical protein
MKIEASPIIECTLDKIELSNHEETKEKLMRVITDLYSSNVNYNTHNHASVWMSPNGLQSIHSFADFAHCDEIVAYANIMQKKFQIKSNRRVAIKDMWVTITPPGGQILPKPRIKSLITGTYFLSTPPENASMNFRKPIDPHWFQNVYDPFHRTPANCPEEVVTMHEGYIYFYPSYIESYTSTNLSGTDRITLDFIMDAVDK